MTTVVKLKYPFKFGDRDIDEVTLQRLKGKHIKKLSGHPTMADLLDLASKSAGEPPAVFEEMDAEDVSAVTEVIGGFLGASLPTGANS